jgi:hypothetical protein
LKAFEMLAGAVEKFRIRRVGKRFLVEVDDAEIFHGGRWVVPKTILEYHQGAQKDGQIMASTETLL